MSIVFYSNSSKREHICCVVNLLVFNIFGGIGNNFFVGDEIDRWKLDFSLCSSPKRLLNPGALESEGGMCDYFTIHCVQFLCLFEYGEIGGEYQRVFFVCVCVYSNMCAPRARCIDSHVRNLCDRSRTA